MPRFALSALAPRLRRLGIGALIAVALPLPAVGASHNCIDLNIASRDQLRMIIDIDEVRSQEIIDRRQQRRFGSVEEIARVPGIAQGRLRDILARGVACVDGDKGGRR